MRSRLFNNRIAGVDTQMQAHRRAAGCSLPELAIAEDNLSPPANLVFFRLLAGHAPLDADLARHLTATAFAALRA